MAKNQILLNERALINNNKKTNKQAQFLRKYLKHTVFKVQNRFHSTENSRTAQ